MQGTTELDSKILEKLDEWERRDGQLSKLAEFYRDILRIQSEAKSRIFVDGPSMSKDLVYDRLREGIPLLLYKDFCPDWQQVKEIFEQVAAWMAKDSEEPLADLDALKNIARQTSLLKEVVGLWYRADSLTTIARTRDIDEGLLMGVVSTSLKPFLYAYSRLLLPKVDQKLWRRRYCPVCGGKPDFTYLDKERGARWLVCSRCDAEWLFWRLQCPYCGTRTEDALAYFTDEEESYLYRLYVCEKCRTYIKAIDLRCAESEVLLPLERVMTLDMDKQACEKGYRAGWASLTV